MDNIMQYIPLAVSAVLLAALILTVVTNIITQVLKKLTWEKIPTNILAFLVAMAVTLLAFFAACQIMAWAVTWYMVAGAVALGLFVAYAAMFGYDKLREPQKIACFSYPSPTFCAIILISVWARAERSFRRSVSTDFWFLV